MSLSRKVYAELPRYPSEKAFVDATLAELEPDFHVEREVVLEHWMGKQLKVDAVMWPREPQLWKDERPVFAVEFKMPMLFHTGDGWQSAKDFTAWAAQSVDYANSLWRGPFGDQRLRIFTCPSVTAPFEEVGPSNPESLTLTDPAFYMSRLLWQLGVGELAKLERDGWTLLGQGNHVLWSQQRGVHEGKRWSLTQPVGSH
ncbi:hypothetical protein [Mycobacterium sp. GA-1841]|uniref:hypothetical protein n=1 Tax=Mycobacterium sp. GA-1841 TaxID=1834154 RepID=UPI0011155D37|nr:hypothetical protein [Mycobacterium sp. GA-1841]